MGSARASLVLCTAARTHHSVLHENASDSLRVPWAAPTRGSWTQAKGTWPRRGGRSRARGRDTATDSVPLPSRRCLMGARPARVAFVRPHAPSATRWAGCVMGQSSVKEALCTAPVRCSATAEPKATTEDHNETCAAVLRVWQPLVVAAEAKWPIGCSALDASAPFATPQRSPQAPPFSRCLKKGLQVCTTMERSHARERNWRVPHFSGTTLAAFRHNEAHGTVAEVTPPHTHTHTLVHQTNQCPLPHLRNTTTSPKSQNQLDLHEQPPSRIPKVAAAK